GRPARDDERVRDEHARRPLVRAEDAYWFAGLDEQGLIALQARERLEDAVERGPRARRAARAAVHDEIFRALCDVGVEVVLDHAERGLLRPGETVQRAAATRPTDARRNGHGSIVHRRRLLPPRREPRSRGDVEETGCGGSCCYCSLAPKGVPPRRS